MDPFSSRTWHVQYSSRKLWHAKRNVQANFTASNSLDYTYQELDASEIETCRETNWKVVADGKDGKLESWMTETDMGIVDTAGEIRADWRSFWLVVGFAQKLDTSDEYDVLCSRRKILSDETMKDILGIHKSRGNHFPVAEGMALMTVPDDGGRNAEMNHREEQMRKEWSGRTGKNEGISEDLIYDGMEKEVSRCLVQ